MNEELKIIIKAVTDSAQKAVKGVSDEIKGISKESKKSSGSIGAFMKGIGKGALVAVASIAAVGAAIVALGKKSLEFTREHSKLLASFQAVGASAKNAETTYNGLYRFLGDKGKATEAASHLALIATNQEQLAEWTRISQGVYSRFGDSLPIEGLTEAANETLRVGKVTGTLADALNWAGVSEDEFNAKLAATNSYSEREALLRNTLNDLYGEAADIYEKNNKALLDYNESQARVDASMAEAGAVITPLLTALNNLGTAFFNILKPALDVIIPPIAEFVNWLAKAIQSVTAFFSALTGKSTKITTTAQGIGAAANSAKSLGTGMGNVEKASEGAAKAAEKAKKAIMGFDELNVISSGSAASGGGGGTGSGEPGYATNGGFNPGMVFDAEAEESGTSKFAETVKKTFKEIGDYLKSAYKPSIEAWADGFETLKQAWGKAKPHLKNGVDEIKDGFIDLGTYILGDFVPNVVNSFNTNFVPMFADLYSFALVEGAKTFEWLGKKFNEVANDILIPAYQSIETVITDLFDSVGSAWDEYGKPFISELEEAFAGTRDLLDTLYNEIVLPIWNILKSAFDEIWSNSLKPLFDSLSETVAVIMTELSVLYNEFLLPFFEAIAITFAPAITAALDAVMIVFELFVEILAQGVSALLESLQGLIKFIVGVFTGDWEKAWEGIKQILLGIWEAIKNSYIKLWETLKSLLPGVCEWIEQAAKDIGQFFVDAWQTIEDIWHSIPDFFKGIWKDVKNAFSEVKKWFSDIFTGAWNGIKKAFSSVGSFFKGVWQEIKSIFSTVGKTIGDAVSGAFKTAINWVLEKAVGLINGFISAINSAISVINAIPGVSIKKLKKLDVPELATGGIVSSATLAMIGERGKEAVLPLENNTGWMDKLAEKLSSRTQTPTKIVLAIDGRELGYATLNSINNITQQTGKLQLVLA